MIAWHLAMTYNNRNILIQRSRNKRTKLKLMSWNRCKVTGYLHGLAYSLFTTRWRFLSPWFEVRVLCVHRYYTLLFNICQLTSRIIDPSRPTRRTFTYNKLSSTKLDNGPPIQSKNYFLSSVDLFAHSYIIVLNTKYLYEVNNAYVLTDPKY